MNKLSIDFAFEGFRIIRERPWLIPLWGLLLLGANLVSLALSTYVFPGYLEALQGMSTQPTPDPTVTMARMSKVVPFLLTMAPLMLVLYTVLSCAVYRCVLDGGKAGLAYLRLGGDELRQLVLLVIYFFISIGVYLITILAGTLIVMMLTFVLTIISPVLAGVGAFIGVIAVVVAFFWIMGRLSLFGPQSFDQKRINVFGSWALTEGYGWTMFWGYCIMVIMMVVVWALCFGIFFALASSINGGDLTSVWTQFSSAQAMGVDIIKNPVVLAYVMTMGLIVSPLIQAMSHGAPASAYKMLAGATKVRAENIF